MIEIEPIYDTYAPIYDAIGQGRFGEYMAGWTLDWLNVRGVQIERVLDLSCGAGSAAFVFAAAGCEVVGVDQSRAMLEIARGKARDSGHAIALIEADIRGLLTNDQMRASRSSFDVVTCFADSLNYLIEDGDLDIVFTAVAEVLRLGGYLVFDLNTEAEYATWIERDVVTYDGHDCLVYNQLHYDAETHRATGRIVWFVREVERWWRGEETHVQRAWSDIEVRSALAGAGLDIEATEQLDEEHREQEARRVVWVGRKREQ